MDKALEVRGREAWEDGRAEGRMEERAEFLSLLSSGKPPVEILKQYGYK
jgi:hypothetical protein